MTEEQNQINALMLDMIANTDCSWAVATAAVAFWQHHIDNSTAPIYGLVGEDSNICYDAGDTPRSLKVGHYLHDMRQVWYFTIQSEPRA